MMYFLMLIVKKKSSECIFNIVWFMGEVIVPLLSQFCFDITFFVLFLHNVDIHSHFYFICLFCNLMGFSMEIEGGLLG